MVKEYRVKYVKVKDLFTEQEQRPEKLSMKIPE